MKSILVLMFGFVLLGIVYAGNPNDLPNLPNIEQVPEEYHEQYQQVSQELNVLKTQEAQIEETIEAKEEVLKSLRTKSKTVLDALIDLVGAEWILLSVLLGIPSLVATWLGRKKAFSLLGKLGILFKGK